MTATTRRVTFIGLDPVPVDLLLPAEVSEAAILTAAGIPDSLFLRTVRPYRLQQPAPDTYELVIGPEGFGAVLLEALQWLARVTAAGIVGALQQAQVLAYVQQYLENQRPDWRFEEITEHAATFINERYRRLETEVSYYQTLSTSGEPALATLVEELQRWVGRHS
jgi:hypothetical protein